MNMKWYANTNAYMHARNEYLHGHGAALSHWPG